LLFPLLTFGIIIIVGRSQTNSPKKLMITLFLVVVGVSRHGEPVILLVKTLPSNLRTLMDFILLLELISWSWKVISGSTIGRSLPSFLLPIIVTDVVIRLLLWRWTIRSIKRPRNQFMSIASFLSLILRQETKVGTRVRVLRTTFFKIKIVLLMCITPTATTFFLEREMGPLDLKQILNKSDTLFVLSMTVHAQRARQSGVAVEILKIGDD
jgi:hypothetical protein